MLAATWFGWGSDADDTDAVVEEQMAVYESKIEACQEAMPVPAWDGYGGLVKVSEEHLAQQVQELTQRHLAARQAVAAAVKVATGDPPCMTSPFAAAQGPGTDGGGAAPSLPSPFRAAIARAGPLLERGDWDGAGVQLQTALTAIPLHASEALEAVVDLAYDCTPSSESAPPRSGLHRPRSGEARQEVQQALAFLRRNEPRRALAALRSATEALQGERNGPDAFCVRLLTDFIRSKRHV